MNVGTATGAAPSRRKIVTVLSGVSCVPDTGFWSITRPGLSASVSRNFTSACSVASSSSSIARSCVKPITFGTGTGVVSSPLSDSNPWANR